MHNINACRDGGAVKENQEYPELGGTGPIWESKAHLDQKHHFSRRLVCGDRIEGLLKLTHLHLNAHGCRQAQQLQFVLQAESAHHMTRSELPVLHRPFWPGLQADHSKGPANL